MQHPAGRIATKQGGISTPRRYRFIRWRVRHTCSDLPGYAHEQVVTSAHVDGTSRACAWSGHWGGTPLRRVTCHVRPAGDARSAHDGAAMPAPATVVGEPIADASRGGPADRTATTARGCRAVPTSRRVR